MCVSNLKLLHRGQWREAEIWPEIYLKAQRIDNKDIILDLRVRTGQNDATSVGHSMDTPFKSIRFGPFELHTFISAIRNGTVNRSNRNRARNVAIIPANA